MFDLYLAKRRSHEGKSKRRRKIFEDLRDKNIMPFKRNLSEFLQKVEERCPGSLQIYQSYLWKFLDKKPLTASELRLLILDMLKYYEAFEIKRCKRESDTIDKFFSSRFIDLKSLTDYILNLQDVASLISNRFDRLAFFGALFREAYYGVELELASYLKGVYINHLFEISETIDWPDEWGYKFEQICLGRLYVHTYIPGHEYKKLVKKSARSSPAYNLLIRDKD